MPKEFKYRGNSPEDLRGMSNETFFELLNSRQRRTIKRGFSENHKKLLKDIKNVKDSKSTNPIKTHSRDMIILPGMIDLTISVYNGKEFISVKIKPEMIGHYIGEFVITNKKVTHGTPGIGASKSSLYVPLK